MDQSLTQTFPGVPAGGKTAYDPGSTAADLGTSDPSLRVILLLIAAVAGTVFKRSIQK